MVAKRPWTLTHALLLTTIIACIVSLPQTEGCGTRVTRVNEMVLSPDGTRLAVSRLDARVSQGSGKRWYDHFWQTFSLLDTDRGRVEKLLMSDRISTLYRQALHNRPSSFNWIQFTDSRLYLQERITNLQVYDHEGNRQEDVTTGGRYIHNCAVTKDDQWAIVSDFPPDTIQLISTHDQTIRWQVEGRFHGALLGANVKLYDELALILDAERVRLVSSETGELVFEKLLPKDRDWEAAYLAKRKSLLVIASDEGFGITNLETREQRWKYARLVHLSPDGRFLVTEKDDQTLITDLESDATPIKLPVVMDNACISPDGLRLYAANDSLVTCYEVSNGKRLWSTSVHGHFRPTWIWPVGIGGLCIWLWRRKNRSMEIAV